MSAKYRRLTDALIAEIRTGQRRPGDLLPSVRELSVEHGQTVAQRALRELVAEGWATAAPGSGTYVADVLPNTTPTLEERVTALEEWRRRCEDQQGQD